MKKHKIIAIIPARGGSKRLSKKNIRPLSGKPLIAWTIEAALKSKYVGRVIVSTEDKEIARVSEKWGAEVIKRPEILATDTTKTTDVIFHALNVLKKQKTFPYAIVVLQPTSPLRKAADINKAINIFLKHKSGSVVSVSETPNNFWWALKNKKEYLEPVFGWQKFFKRSQYLPKIFIPNGAIYVLMPQTLLRHKIFYLRNKTFPCVMPAERSIDIDYEIDFKLAEFIFKKTNEKNKNRK
ncbi:acylneuraminate cytidylyltransferase family protein [Patescibacteria group bacterium]|nr:acylneuraminate cytidylyltransferase family protein [Patescibacteria group bacterium]